jgi:DnaK suppressor protein
MADVTHASLRDQLTDERGRLVDQLRQMGHGPEGALSFDDGFADSGQVTAERGEVEALAGKLLETLEEIDEALMRFDAGTYGRCERCGDAITEARLAAMPAARLCMSCASKRR